LKITQVIREKIEHLLKATQVLELANRRKAALAYSPNAHERFRLAAEQNARDAAELNESLRR
jgi:hypothetical protein